MNVRSRRSYLSLPEREKQIINEEITKEVVRLVNHNHAEVQKVWLQLACIVLNKNFGYGKNRLLLFLANWKEMYRLNSEIDGTEARDKWLKEEMTKIFGEGGYPYAYIDKLEDL
jgi:hypothetical protein